MKKNTNKLTWLLSLTLAMALMLSACQNKTTEPAVETQATVEEATTSEVVVEDATVEVETADVDAADVATTEEVVSDDKAELSFVLTVVYADETSKDFAITTTATTLREALETEGLISGTESEYGLYVLSVNDVTADEATQQWWCLTKNGEMWNDGVDTTLLSDGDQYEFTLTTGW